FRIVRFGRFSHTTRVDDEQVTTLIELQQLNRTPDHVGQSGFVIPSGLIATAISVRKRSEKFRPPPHRNGLQFGSGPDYVETALPQFYQKIAIVFSFPLFC